MEKEEWNEVTKCDFVPPMIMASIPYTIFTIGPFGCPNHENIEATRAVNNFTSSWLGNLNPADCGLWWFDRRVVQDLRTLSQRL